MFNYASVHIKTIIPLVYKYFLYENDIKMYVR